MILKINNREYPIIFASDLKTKLQGLSNMTNINFGMYFNNCNAIQTYTMKEPIDVLVLDNQNIILFILNDFKPYKILSINRDIYETNILELPKGLGKYFKVGNQIKFIKK